MLSQRLYENIFLIALFNAVLQFVISREEYSLIPHASEIQGENEKEGVVGEEDKEEEEERDAFFVEF